MSEGVTKVELPGIPLISRGKVRDIYDLGDELLIIATDRISAFDYVLPDPIPDKGKVLNQLAEFWFQRTQRSVLNHLISIHVEDFPEVLRPHDDLLRGRAMLARKLRMLPVECVARGYLAGSGWKEYRESGTVCGIPLPAGLQESSRLPEAIFTPSTKAETGHDENIPFSEVERLVGAHLARLLRDRTLELYTSCAEFARTRGLIIADTKFEFGQDGENLVLGDEVLTPDSSRFWPADRYEPGRGQPSFDKQFVRDWLESSGWNKQPPVPSLPAEIIEGTRRRYLEGFRILTGRELE